MKRHVLALLIGAAIIAAFVGLVVAIVISPIYVAMIAGGITIAVGCYCLGRAAIMGTRWDRP